MNGAFVMNEMKAIIENIQENVQSATLKSGRAEGDVRIVAVSKTYPAEAVQAAYETGLSIFGETCAQSEMFRFGGTGQFVNRGTPLK